MIPITLALATCLRNNPLDAAADVAREMLLSDTRTRAFAGYVFVRSAVVCCKGVLGIVCFSRGKQTIPIPDCLDTIYGATLVVLQKPT